MPVRAYGNQASNKPLEPKQINRRDCDVGGLRAGGRQIGLELRAARGDDVLGGSWVANPGGRRALGLHRLVEGGGVEARGARGSDTSQAPAPLRIDSAGPNAASSALRKMP